MIKEKPFKYFNTAIAAAVVASGVAVVAPNATEASTLFPDVKEDDYFYDAVTYLALEGFVNGFPDGTYGPYKNITRGQVAVILANALGLDTENVADPGFKDVPKTHDYYGAIAALANAGYVSGYKDDTYKPGEQISRYHMGLIIASAYKLKAKNVDALPFTDVVDDYKEKIAALYENGVTAGTTKTTFSGNNKVTRGQMAVFIDAAEQAANPAFTIDEITDSKIVTDNGEYAFSEDLAGIFAEGNHVALKDAHMIAKVEYGEIVEIQVLFINTAGTETESVVFDAGNGKIEEDLIVNADFVEVKNLTVNGDVYLTEAVDHDFATENLEIGGELVIWEEIEEEEIEPVASLMSTFATTQSSTSGPEINLTDSTVNSIIAERNHIALTSNTKLPEVTLLYNVNSIELNAEVESVTVNNAVPVQISGTGSINKVTVIEATEVTLNVPGQVKELVVANKDASVSLGENVTVEKLVIPTGSDVSTIIENYNNVKENITDVVDEEGVAIDTTTVSVSTIDSLLAALADDQIKTINLTADIENVSERIVVDRAVTINGGEHTISFTNAINELAYGSRHGLAVVADDVKINDLSVKLTQADQWQGAYAVQVFDAKNVTLNNYAGTGADAALLVNGSKVKLTGSIDVSGNEFGGIESSMGNGLTVAPSIDATEATFINTTEAYGLPTIWEDKVSGTVTVKEATFTANDTVKAGQVQFYAKAENAVDPLATVNVANLTELKDALSNERVQMINLTADLENVAERIVVDRAVTINGGEHKISFTKAINELAYGSRHGLAVVADDVTISDLSVQLTQANGWQGAYAVQVYDAQNVTLNNFTGTGADAALLVNASNVELTGTTTVSGNEFGGIEVSKGTVAGLSNSTLKVTGELVNETEKFAQPTVWLVNGQGAVEGNVPTFENNTIKADQTQFYLTNEAATSVEVASLEELQAALLVADIQTINLSADIKDVTQKIAFNRAVTINGNGHTISFTEAINSQPYGSRHGIAVTADDVTINALKVALTAAESWQGAYAIQVYNAQNVNLNNFTGTGADAALLVNASEVELTGTTTVSGNEFGGIEVSKGSGAELTNAYLNVTGTIANADEAYGEPTIWLVHNLDATKTAQGTVSGSALNGAGINYLDLADKYQTQYYLNSKPVQLLNVTKNSSSINSNHRSAIGVTAHSVQDLNKLEVDHNIPGLPEFSVYANATNPYGSAEAKNQFEALGVKVTYDATAKKWTIDFGTTVSNQLAAQGNVTFYFVITDQNGYKFGSMYNPTRQNTFSLTF